MIFAQPRRMPPLPNHLFLLSTAISSQNLQEEHRRLKQRAVLSPAISLRRLQISASATGSGTAAVSSARFPVESPVPPCSVAKM